AHYSMGWLPVWARLAALAPGVVNAALRQRWLARPAKRLAGIAAERSLPAFAAVPFPGRARRGVGNPAGTGIPAGAGDVPYAGGPAGTDVGDLAGTGDLASGGIPAGTGHVPGPGGLVGGGVAGTSGPSSGGGRRVVLFPDTFTRYFDPQVAVAAVRVLRAAGYAVELPPRPVCCGLTWVSTGQLGMARRVLRRT